MELSLDKNIRELRRQRRMTQEQLSEVLGVTPGRSTNGRPACPCRI